MKLGTDTQSVRGGSARSDDSIASKASFLNEEALQAALRLPALELSAVESRSNQGTPHELISELSHDLRQPLTSLKMNLQCAVRLLQLPNPRVSVALEALTDCLDMESDITELLAHAYRRAKATVTTTTTFALNDVVHDIVTTIRCFEPAWRRRLIEHLADESPLVDGRAWRLRFPLLTTIRHLLLLDELSETAGDPMRIEVRTMPEGAQIVLSQLHAGSLDARQVQPMLGVLRTVTVRLGGTVTTERQDDRGLVLISLPLAPPHMRMLPGGPHGI